MSGLLSRSRSSARPCLAVCLGHVHFDEGNLITSGAATFVMEQMK